MSSSSDSWPSHGGQVRPLLERFGLDRAHEVLDFSANINPLGPPAWLPERLVAALSGLERYPDPDYPEARRAIAEAEGVSDGQVLLTNGGVEGIFLAAALHAGARAAIVQPTFTEYARACGRHGLGVERIDLEGACFMLDEAQALSAMDRCDVIFLCRPNNPTGTLVERETLESLLAAGRRRGCTLVVDEAFIDFVTPDERLTPLLTRYPNLLLLRSLTKLYAIPGLRLGYLLASQETIERVRSLQMPWSVNHLAASLVAALLADRAFRERTSDWLASEHPRLQQGLAAAGLDVVPSRANFFLVRPGKGRQGGDALFEGLLRAGILARHTHNFPNLDGAWLRLALRARHDNDRLLSAVGEAGRGP